MNSFFIVLRARLLSDASGLRRAVRLHAALEREIDVGGDGAAALVQNIAAVIVFEEPPDIVHDAMVHDDWLESWMPHRIARPSLARRPAVECRAMGEAAQHAVDVG